MKNIRIPKILKNKYGIALVLFSLWMLILDENNLFRQIKITIEYRKMKKERLYFEKEIHDNATGVKKLSDDPDLLEKLARERYMMKKSNEDVFLIIPD